jgi:hypothetical protein
MRRMRIRPLHVSLLHIRQTVCASQSYFMQTYTLRLRCVLSHLLHSASPKLFTSTNPQSIVPSSNSSLHSAPSSFELPQPKTALVPVPLPKLPSQAHIPTSIRRLFGTSTSTSCRHCSLSQIATRSTSQPSSCCSSYSSANNNAKTSRS